MKYSKQQYAYFNLMYNIYCMTNKCQHIKKLKVNIGMLKSIKTVYEIAKSIEYFCLLYTLTSME